MTMALFSPKKTRSQRAAAFRSSSTPSGRFDETQRNRRVTLRILLCVVAVVGLLFAVEGWRAPFPYRLSDREAHGITARIKFQQFNDFETQRARQERVDQVPFIFEHNPKPLLRLPDDLKRHLNDVGEGSTGNRINELVDDFKQFLQPLEQCGVIDPDDLSGNNIRSGSAIAIVSPARGKPATIVAAEDVQLAVLLKDTGKLGEKWDDYPKLAAIRPMLEPWLLSQDPITLRYDSLATQRKKDEAANAVEDKYDPYNPGDPLVEPGKAIDEKRLAVLRAEYDAIEQNVPRRQRVVRVLTVLAMFGVLAVLYGYYLLRNERRLVGSVGRLSVYLAVIVLAVGLGRLLSYDPWRAEIIPLMATVMVLAIAYNQVLATLTAFMLALIITFSTVGELGQFVLLMSVAATAVIPLRRVPSRSTLIKVGFWTAGVYFVVSWGNGIIRSQSPSEVWSDSTLLFTSLRGSAWCLAGGYLVAGSLPFIESAFDVVTDISLLEMSDISHPLLHELVRRAPGTYNHSITVATIGEAAADRIGANGLLVRVGAYFHDVGKMLKPEYFVENMTEGTASRHEHLAPAMSTLIIIGHVKDGVDLAQRHNVPQRVIDFVEQHHGTTLVQYFYHAAAKQADRQPDHKTDAEESSFRYPGPKPQSRETGVLMLADAVEGASRTLTEPTPKRIEGLVHDLTMKRLLDGQFAECSLTLSEIHAIEESLTKSLIGIYHGRIKYPEQRTA